MCEKCVDAVKQYWPSLPENQYGNLLYGATSFPFGDHEQVCKQVKELAEQTGCNLDQAIAIACEEMDREMKAARDTETITPLQEPSPK